ncbi:MULTISPECIES: GIY-YIG nuclease family protein [unclassified Mesorhizobium]|uniref:GIY-YIG nuclease family protein n=1 Tax=unclassified Mesorhizobium TaxID=325217 RepID=UPI000FE9B25F|nr:MULTISPECIES: GIY-YIG nuclease family protein [unclassified Mesorhizobium]RWG07363.1 MAG: GIY-YIG nuclease family protein [Mesorhizobium sp.]RWH03723.1 MAG: GIY-YIG nuclease family protein [Mesorhizobium sp.]TIN42096.1 MAG: GIY-YIG nuclease family protein [Mesorhizobium sp.]TIR93809.1 MAG: GIY-YIG nuclease family protein [Mesorhizobium sp.]TIS01892.1 MAG: GIY-YIG nuclease family protein [Mesorhizobium sp.]
MQSVVYFVKSGPAIKIGYSANLPRRLNQLKYIRPAPGGRRPIELLGTIPGGITEEARVHARFQRLKTSRHPLCEWFVDSPEIRQFIAANCRSTEIRRAA